MFNSLHTTLYGEFYKGITGDIYLDMLLAIPYFRTLCEEKLGSSDFYNRLITKTTKVFDDYYFINFEKLKSYRDVTKLLIMGFFGNNNKSSARQNIYESLYKNNLAGIVSPDSVLESIENLFKTYCPKIMDYIYLTIYPYTQWHEKETFFNIASLCEKANVKFALVHDCVYTEPRIAHVFSDDNNKNLNNVFIQYSDIRVLNIVKERIVKEKETNSKKNKVLKKEKVFAKQESNKSNKENQESKNQLNLFNRNFINYKLNIKYNSLYYYNLLISLFLLDYIINYSNIYNIEFLIYKKKRKIWGNSC